MASEMQFEFMGFYPDQKMRRFVSTVAEELHGSSPSDSAMKLVLEKNESDIKASCRIVSQTGAFVAEAMGDTPVRAVQKIEKKMKDQLDSWKRRRFGNN